MVSKNIRIAHLSDLHCYRLTYSPSQLFSKRWLGNFNLLFNRQCDFYKDPHPSLAPLLTAQGVEHLVISGDLSMTARKSEFEAAKTFTDAVEREGISTHIIPGNHDNYTRCAYRKQLFYSYFGDQKLKTQGVTAHKLGANWWWVGLDTSLATHLIASTGLFAKHLEDPLRQTLRQVPEGDNVVLANHFPLFPTRRRSHRLLRAEQLRQLLIGEPKVRLYLHGHIHRQSIRDERAAKLPIILNSGSCGMSKGKASLNLIDLKTDGCTVHVYHQAPDEAWSLTESSSFSWDPDCHPNLV